MFCWADPRLPAFVDGVIKQMHLKNKQQNMNLAEEIKTWSIEKIIYEACCVDKLVKKLFIQELERRIGISNHRPSTECSHGACPNGCECPHCIKE